MISKNILLIMLVVLSLPVMMAQETTTRTTLETDAVSADAEVRTVSERDFVLRTRAQIQLNFGGEVFRGQSILHLDSINLEEGETYRCGVGEQGRIVCQSATSDDLWCWGRGELSRCPQALSEADNLRISAGGGAGKVSVQDFTTKSARDDEIEVYAWSWGTSSPAGGFDDTDELTLEYAWFVNSKASGDGEPAETLSLSFTKIEMAGFEDDDSITVEIEEIRVPEHGILFGTLTLEGEAKKAITGRNPQTGKEIQIAAGVGEDGQERPEEERRPDYLDVDSVRLLSKADAKKALEGFTRSISGIQSSLERCESDVCRQVSANADKRYELVEKAKADIINSPPFVSEVRSIVLEDIAALERCGTDVCREILSQERELLLAVSNYGDVDGDGIPDFRDADDDGDRVPTTMETNRGVIHRDLAARNALEWSEEERGQVRETLQNMETLQGRDFGLAVALSASENERVRSVKYDEERNVVEIEHEEDMRLFGMLRMNARSTTTVHENGTEETRRPWWSFMATKQEGPKFKAGAELSKSVN